MHADLQTVVYKSEQIVEQSIEPRTVIEGLIPALACSTEELVAAHIALALKCGWLCADNWSQKAVRRKTTGTGRMRHLKVVLRKFKNGFREGECRALVPDLICRSSLCLADAPGSMRSLAGHMTRKC